MKTFGFVKYHSNYLKVAQFSIGKGYQQILAEFWKEVAETAMLGPGEHEKKLGWKEKQLIRRPLTFYSSPSC